MANPPDVARQMYINRSGQTYHPPDIWSHLPFKGVRQALKSLPRTPYFFPNTLLIFPGNTVYCDSGHRHQREDCPE